MKCEFNNDNTIQKQKQVDVKTNNKMLIHKHLKNI